MELHCQIYMLNNSWPFDSAAKAHIPDRAPDCFKCRYFKITWEPVFPRSCDFFCIKCQNLPSMEVFLSTGKHCFAFSVRDLPKEENSGSEGILV